MSRLIRPRVNRRDQRNRLYLQGTCRFANRPAHDVRISDLSVSGCNLSGSALAVTKVMPIEVWLGEYGPVVARLKWARRGAIGVEFVSPLDATVVEGLAVQGAGPIPIVRRASARRG